MYPYQLSKVLADQRIHDMLAAAERHRMTATRRQKLTNGPMRLSAVITRLRTTTAQLRGPRTRDAHPTATRRSDAGPVSC